MRIKSGFILATTTSNTNLFVSPLPVKISLEIFVPRSVSALMYKIFVYPSPVYEKCHLRQITIARTIQ